MFFLNIIEWGFDFFLQFFVTTEGEWDGTRAYGETLLAGRKTLEGRFKLQMQL
jgi:hypothetical protein